MVEPVGEGALRRVTTLLFPRGVRVVHFVLVPAVGMAVALAAFRVLDGWVLPALGEVGRDVYLAFRTVAIATLMSSLIALLAFRYRTDYEAKLRARNQMLEATRDFLTRIIEGAAEAIITRDEQGRVTSWNAAAEAIYGWTAAEMLGKSVDRLVPDDPAARAEQEEIQRRLSAGESIRHREVRRVHKEGKLVTVSITMAPMLDASRRYAGSIGIVRDVTDLKEMEQRLVEQERLAAVGELAAMVAHEVRNPLAGIRGACEILLEGYAGDPARTEIGREVLHQVDRLNRTVSDLLLYARPKAMDPVPTDVHALIDRISSVLKEDPANRALSISREYEAGNPVVRADGRQLEQLFLNLMLNAAQATQHRGILRIGTQARDGTFVVTVQDDGPGIPPDRIERIFKPFFTTRTQGTGLGLAICKKIVDGHGGRIDVESPSEGGARFTILLHVEGPPTP